MSGPLSLAAWLFVAYAGFGLAVTAWYVVTLLIGAAARRRRNRSHL